MTGFCRIWKIRVFLVHFVYAFNYNRQTALNITPLQQHCLPRSNPHGTQPVIWRLRTTENSVLGTFDETAGLHPFQITTIQSSYPQFPKRRELCVLISDNSNIAHKLSRVGSVSISIVRQAVWYRLRVLWKARDILTPQHSDTCQSIAINAFHFSENINYLNIK
jgi:hypothetical protein